MVTKRRPAASRGPRKANRKPTAYVPEDDADIDAMENGEEEQPVEPSDMEADEIDECEDDQPLMSKKPAAAGDTEGLLEKQMEAMRKYCQEKKITQPSTEILNKFLFNPTLKAGAWQKLKLARGKESMSVQEAWGELCKVKAGKGKTAEKNAILFHFVRGDPKWGERLERQSLKITNNE